MATSERFRQCLQDLSIHCESLCAENERLRSQQLTLDKPANVWTAPGLVPSSDILEPKAAAEDAVLKFEAKDRWTAAGGSTGEPADEDRTFHQASSVVPVESESTLAGMRLGMLTSAGPLTASITLAATPLENIFKDVCAYKDPPVMHTATGSLIAKSACEGFRKAVDGMGFRSLCMFMIFANTVYLGHSADRQVKNSFRRISGQEQDEDWNTPDIMFAVWFMVELLLRVSAAPKEFLFGSDWRWNLFDGVLVVNSVIEITVPGFSNFSFLRILRVFRVVRFVRVVRTVKALASLRTMVFALMNSFFCLMWAFLMIFIIIFIFAIMFDGAVSSYFDGITLTSEDEIKEALLVHECFGSLFETMVSLFAAITGGNDWMAYGELLRNVGGGSQQYFMLFAFYIGFCLVGMLNVVTGIFVDSAVCTRTEDEVVKGWEDEQIRTSEKVRQIFKEADTNCSGNLSMEELVAKLENPWVKAYFSGLDIDPSEARIMFTLMDTDGDDTVSIEEFVNGTMKLKGQAKSIDIMALMFDQARFAVKFDKLCAYIEDHLQKIEKLNLMRKDEKRTLRANLPQDLDSIDAERFEQAEALPWNSTAEADQPLLQQMKFSKLREGESSSQNETATDQHSLGYVSSASAQPEKKPEKRRKNGENSDGQRQGRAPRTGVVTQSVMAEPFSVVPGALMRPEQASSDFYL